MEGLKSLERLEPVEELSETSARASLSRSDTHETKMAEDMDPRNPQNWSRSRKTLLFIALMSSSLLADGYVLCTLAVADMAKAWL